MDILTIFLTLLVGLGLGVLVGVLWSRSRPTYTAGLVDQAEVMQGLDRLSDQMHHLDRARATWQGQFDAQVDQLQRETRSLSTALRKPQVRGRWGELHLRRAVELAGLVDRCDFTEQVSAVTDGGLLRPDVVIHLAGGKHVVVDAKVPLDAFLDATGAEEDEEREDDRHGGHAGSLRKRERSERFRGVLMRPAWTRPPTVRRSRDSDEVDDDRGVVGGALAGALLAVDEGTGHTGGEGR